MAEGILFSWESVQRFRASPICFKLLRQAIRLPFSLAELNAGSNIAARMAIMAMTTNNSMRVKARARTKALWNTEEELTFRNITRPGDRDSSKAGGRYGAGGSTSRRKLVSRHNEQCCSN